MITEVDEAFARLKQALVTRAFIRAENQPIARKDSYIRDKGWLFDVRRIALDGAIMRDIAHIFWSTFASQYPFQVGGMESGAIPLVATIVSAGATEKNVSGFYVRKSRKRDGLMQRVEGTLTPGVPIILVDDLVNTGSSISQQVDILTSMGYRIQSVWTLIRFREESFYTYFHERNIPLHSVFSLRDFKESLGIDLVTTQEEKPPMPYRIEWKFEAGNPSYQHVVPKSRPALDDTRVYVGSDQGTLWALNQSDGSVDWSFSTSPGVLRKGIFSSPVVSRGFVYFGSYDGNVYALDATTGKKRWVYLEADWVGSSPVLNSDGSVLFIGLEFGLLRKRGGIVALDAKTGARLWWYADMPCYTHATPLYIPYSDEVAIGSNDGAVYLFNARTGTLKWKYNSGLPTKDELGYGFSAYDIKGSLAYDAARDQIVMANKIGVVSYLTRTSGAPRAHFSAGAGFFSSPLVYKGRVYVSSLDKYVYCLGDAAQLLWSWYAGARIFSSPVVIGESLYIGANSGILTELDPETGEERSVFAATERITNAPVYSPATKKLFVPTCANELYCVVREEPRTPNGTHV